MNSSAANDDGRDSLASTTTASHLSSSHRKLASLLKRLLLKCITKSAALLLNLFYGYQFAQNVFIHQIIETDSSTHYTNNPFTLFIHLFIFACGLFRCTIIFASKKNSLNKMEHLRKLEQKQKVCFRQQYTFFLFIQIYAV